MERAGCVQEKEESNLSWVGETAREGWPGDAGEVSDSKAMRAFVLGARDPCSIPGAGIEDCLCQR